MDIIYSYYKSLDDENWHYRFHGTTTEFSRSTMRNLLPVDLTQVQKKLDETGRYVLVDDELKTIHTIYLKKR